MRQLFPLNVFVSPQTGPSRRLLVGESPGEQEKIIGKPFVGGAGKWLDSALRQARLRREDLNVINVIQCQPPDNVFPTSKEAVGYIPKADGQAAVDQCVKNHVLPFIARVQPTNITLLGDKALQALANVKGGIFKWRGSPLELEIAGGTYRGIATLHPAYIMRDQTMFPVLVNDLGKTLVQPPENYQLAPTMEEVRNLDAEWLAFDIETRGWSRDISMIGLSPKVYHAWVPPFEGGYVNEVRELFRRAKNLIGHNCVQFDLPVLAYNGVVPDPDCEVWDTMLIHHLLFPQFSGEQQKSDEDPMRKTSGGHGLEFLNSQFTSKPAWKHGKGENEELYCARDVDVTHQCFSVLHAMLRKENLVDLYRYVQVPLAKICKLMHDTGFKIEPARLKEIRTQYLSEMNTLEGELPQPLRTQTINVHKRVAAPPGTLTKAGKPRKFVLVDAEEEVVPWRSPAAITQWLYEELGLPVQYHIKTGEPTTDKIAVERLFHRLQSGGIKHDRAAEIIKEISAYRKLKKLSTLVSNFVKDEITSADRLHPNFNVHGTVSGRLSSSDPNLQNIPKSARFIYVPSRPDWCLVEFDYSQIENRLTALFAGDQERLNHWMVDPGFSEHKWVASQFFDLPYESIDKEDEIYTNAKRINHGKNYGMGPKKISNMYDMPFSEVKELSLKWDKINRVTLDWQKRTAEAAKRDGVLVTPFGRKRWFYTQSYYTEALSFLPQSTAADVIFRAMIGLMYERIGWPLEKVLKVVPIAEPLLQPAKLLISVHDSLVFECPAGLVDGLVEVVKKVMTQPWKELGGFSIPVGIKVGEPGCSWGECK